MDDLDYYDLEADIKEVGITPLQIMEKQFYEVCGGKWDVYLQTIEWDTWCEPHDPKALAEIIKEREIKNHPFNKFF
jgi:hypothetical protein